MAPEFITRDGKEEVNGGFRRVNMLGSSGCFRPDSGANVGIGYYTVKQLLEDGRRVSVLDIN